MNNIIRKDSFSEKDRNLVYWWSPGKRRRDLFKSKRENVGDYLSPVIVSKILEKKGFAITDKADKNTRLLAIGSVIHKSKAGDCIWGSGVNGKTINQKLISNRLDVRAVRGPLTKKFLENYDITVPTVYGDPALLLPHLFEPAFFDVKSYKMKSNICVVPHFEEIQKFTNINGKYSLNLPTEYWKKFILKIIKADVVISSSLHGIIVAEAYGKDARLLKVSDTEPLFKYQDYYAGTCRNDFNIFFSVEEALRGKANQKPIFKYNDLLNAFPYELWNSK